jgi:hypothetical protein
VLPVSSTVGPPLRRNWEGRCDSGAKAQPAEGAIEPAGEAREANQENVGDDELDVGACEREREPEMCQRPHSQ